MRTLVFEVSVIANKMGHLLITHGGETLRRRGDLKSSALAEFPLPLKLVIRVSRTESQAGSVVVAPYMIPLALVLRSIRYHGQILDC